MNNPGSVKIAQQGVDRPLYSFENDNKNLHLGFSGSISLNYSISRSTQFFINGDYLQTNASIRLLDKFSGYDVPTKIKRSVKTVMAGIGIIKTFGSKKESSSNLATRNGKQIGQPHYRNKLSPSPENCGPVTLTTAQPKWQYITTHFCLYGRCSAICKQNKDE